MWREYTRMSAKAAVDDTVQAVNRRINQLLDSWGCVGSATTNLNNKPTILESLLDETNGMGYKDKE